MSKETVKFGGATATGFGFGEITSSQGMQGVPMSGILGLAFDTISTDNLPTFIESSSQQDKSFTFVLRSNPEDSLLTIPGFDTSIVADESEFTFHDVIQEAWWVVKGTSM